MVFYVARGTIFTRNDARRILVCKKAIRHIQRAKERDENGVVNNDVACLMFFLNVDIGYIYAVGRNPMLPV